jgi:DNA-binding response OmpR family regulator
MVLIIEDDYSNLKLTEMALRSAHYECVTTDNIKDGWELLQTGLVSVVVADLHIDAVSDAVSLIERMRADPLIANIPVIIASGERGEERRQAALDAGASEFLTKPFPLNDLVARIKQCLARE